ncbi:hypothetical protein LC085_07580 [Bacillus tianshenii]|uniref:hypothetical protein n=1 Tax=Sutcliffiella tianshenii TaxID=1463404 RepID=UPI001CD2A851|nr:hypothetical protein [Bacillus tianshenii]MCA1319772.1 hypothetical protein [Bacillus tianshenii]
MEKVMGIDIRVVTGIISALVAILISVINHFIVEPIKRKRQRKRDQLHNLYAPLYSLFNYRMEISITHIAQTQSIKLGGIKGDEISSKEYLTRLFMEKAGYASESLIDHLTEYCGNINITPGMTDRLVRTTVKEYNQLKKDLKIPYNLAELETGFPELLAKQGFNESNFK